MTDLTTLTAQLDRLDRLVAAAQTLTDDLADLRAEVVCMLEDTEEGCAELDRRAAL